MEQPFIFGGTIFGDHFTDREEDCRNLCNNFRYGINTILISPRRWGKTSLVYKAGKMMAEENILIVYMDMFSCRSEFDFYKIFATNILKQTSSKWEEWVEHAKIFLSRITPKITIGSDPINDFSLSFDMNPKDNSELDILQLPEKIAAKKGCRMVVCIDEFQDIANFSNSKSFQKRLRSVWQLQENVSYCLYGSKQHLMNDLFEKQSFPFYKFGDVYHLQKIDQVHWIPFIVNRFQKTGKQISETLAKEICDIVENQSFYVQQLAWLLWIETDEVATAELLSKATEGLLDKNALLYQQQIGELTSYQMNFLRALASGIETGFSTKTTLTTYNLGSSANLVRIKKALQQKELIDITPKKITFLDPVFKRWFKREVM